MLICFYGDHTHTSTHSNSVSHVLAPSHTRSKRDQARSNSIGLILDERATSLTSSPWLCAFAILAYWILSFCFWGLFFVSFGFGSCRWVRRTGPRGRVRTTGLNRGLMKETKDWTVPLETNTLCHSLSVHTTNGPTLWRWWPPLSSCFCFHPSTEQLDAKISHVCCRFDWGELDGSIYKHLARLSCDILLNMYLICLSLFFVVGLSMPNSVFGHWSLWTWLLNVF